MLQRGDADEGPGDGRDIEGDVGAEALAHEHHAGAPLGRDRGEARLDGLEHVACEHDAVDRLGHREGAGHECVLRHDGRAVAAGEVFERLDDRVVDVADAGGARDADEGSLEATARFEVGHAERGALAQVVGRLVSTHDAHRIDGRLAHHLGDLVMREHHGDKAAALLADRVEGHAACGARGDVRVAGGRGIRRLDDVVLALEAMSDLAQGVGTGQAHGAEKGGVRDEGACRTGIAADGRAHQALQAVGRDLFAHHEGAQADEARGADAGGGEDRADVGALDAVVVGIGVAVLVGAAYGEVDIARSDRRAGEQVGHERRVETGLEVQVLVEYVVPQRCGAAGDAGEGDLAARGVGDGGGRIVGRCLGGGECSRVAADDRAGRDDDARGGAGAGAGDGGEGLERRPRGGGELVVDRGRHAGGDGLVDR